MPLSDYIIDAFSYCDDANELIHPNAIEICNKVDDTCDGLIDKGIGTISNAIPQNGLMMYLPSDGNLFDATGRGHICANFNAAPDVDRFGTSNRSFIFNGVDSRIVIQDHSDLRPASLSICT